MTFFDLFNNWLGKGEPKVPEQLKKFPLLVEHYNRVLNVPEIKAWIEKRPESSFKEHVHVQSCDNILNNRVFLSRDYRLIITHVNVM